LQVDERVANLTGDALYDHCMFTQFDPAPRDEGWRVSKRVPDYL
jgi:serine/threonine-protein phosphatase 2A catalytic subunit